jgi:hypothetical protein
MARASGKGLTETPTRAFRTFCGAFARSFHTIYTQPVAFMPKSFQLLSFAIFLVGVLPSDCQEADLLIDRPADLPSIPGEKGPRVATAEQEAEIRSLVEDFVITDQETRALAAEDERRAKFLAQAEKAWRAPAKDSIPSPDDP